MIDIATGRHVAFMKDAQALRNPAACDFPCDAIGTRGLAIDTDLPISESFPKTEKNDAAAFIGRSEPFLQTHGQRLHLTLTMALVRTKAVPLILARCAALFAPRLCLSVENASTGSRTKPAVANAKRVNSRAEWQLTINASAFGGSMLRHGRPPFQVDDVEARRDVQAPVGPRHYSARNS